jgi:hypothetical protein
MLFTLRSLRKKETGWTSHIHDVWITHFLGSQLPNQPTLARLGTHPVQHYRNLDPPLLPLDVEDYGNDIDNDRIDPHGICFIELGDWQKQ